jgi:integral membrane protein
MTQPAPTPAPAGVTADAATARLKRYRVMAWVTGTMLLVLCLEMVLKYVFHAGGYDAEGHAAPVIGTWVAIAHGWSAMRWSLGRLATMALAGVVPVMSFVLERRVHAQAVARITAG